MANVLDCDTIVSKFKLQSHYYVHLQTKSLGEKYDPLLMNPLSYRLSTTTIDLL